MKNDFYEGPLWKNELEAHRPVMCLMGRENNTNDVLRVLNLSPRLDADTVVCR